jgi:hypothetical protein
VAEVFAALVSGDAVASRLAALMALMAPRSRRA